MTMDFQNVYADARRAEAYAKLEFPGTYYLAYRDLSEIIDKHVKGRKAIDFGCGTGRSTRFLRKHGFEVIGIDIASDMIEKAREMDPQGDYRLVDDGKLSQFEASSYDLVLSLFTFDNIPTMQKKVAIFKQIRNMLNDKGRTIHLVSAPEIYFHEWASFTTRDFPENRTAQSGDRVKIIMTDVDDRRPVEDIIWSDEDYHKVFHEARLQWIETYKPLGTADEPVDWINETRIAPWTIYVLKRAL